MVRSLVGVRIGATVASLGLLAGLVAAPAVGAEARGKQAWWYTAMKIAEAHQETTGKGVTVALIDSPIAPNVPELKGQDVRAVKNFCGGEPTATGTIADHGTSMATFIVGNGRGTGGPGVAGVAPDARLRTYADQSAARNAACALSPSQALASAVREAVADGTRIINVSGGIRGAVDPVADGAIEAALGAGVVVVASAGQSPEDSQVIFPASVPGVVAVAAVDRAAKAWSRNVRRNAGALVISAPGVDIVQSGFNGSKWDSSGLASGTSPAAAIVSGGLALVAAKYPRATGNQLIQHLIHNPGGEDREFGRNDEFGYGIMSVTRMLASDPTQWPDVNPLRPGTGDGGASAAPSGSTSVDGAPVSASGDSGGGGIPVVVFILIGVAVLAVGAVVGLRARGRGGVSG